jgi:hypothetical protein
MLLECRLDVIAECDLAWLARLRRADDSAYDVLTHGESSRDQICIQVVGHDHGSGREGRSRRDVTVIVRAIKSTSRNPLR